MKLIVGLGNPGLRYRNNRHNVGFQIVDALAAAHGLEFGKVKYKARLADGVIGDQRALLIKPMTYMNLSGEAVQPLVHFYKIDLDDLMVVYDDLDLPLGKIRLRPFGGAGGHNGMRSIIQRLGSDRFPRLRVGIDRPPGRMDPAAYVLQDFTPEEEAIMAQVRERAVQALECWLTNGIDAAMNAFNAMKSDLSAAKRACSARAEEDEQDAANGPNG
ncbi:MAG: aminoacyl-tRNA hydrolase [Chloroflexi bacterium]|nr:aminoacyl-tRNA hydrolase [Chloroflexota bacterium]